MNEPFRAFLSFHSNIFSFLFDLRFLEVFKVISNLLQPSTYTCQHIPSTCHSECVCVFLCFEVVWLSSTVKVLWKQLVGRGTLFRRGLFSFEGKVSWSLCPPRNVKSEDVQPELFQRDFKLSNSPPRSTLQPPTRMCSMDCVPGETNRLRRSFLVWWRSSTVRPSQNPLFCFFVSWRSDVQKGNNKLKMENTFESNCIGRMSGSPLPHL